MNIPGWAGTVNEDEGAQKNITSEFNSVAVKCIQDYIVVESEKSGYAHKIIKGYLKEGHPSITVKELAIYLDGGNLCFGGDGIISGNKFEIKIYTD